MDARLDPAKYAGLAESDVHVIRNAGGRASDDVLRPLVISYKLGTREWFVIHHTDCEILLFTNDMRNLLASSLKTATLDEGGWHDSGDGPGSTEGNYINWLTFSDNMKSVVEDVLRIRHHTLVPNDIPIYGYIYDVKSKNSSRFRNPRRLVRRVSRERYWNRRQSRRPLMPLHCWTTNADERPFSSVLKIARHRSLG